MLPFIGFVQAGLFELGGLGAIQAISIGPFDFNGFDTVVLILLIISALYAFARGFLREVVSILALGVAVIVTLFVYGQFRFAARDFIQPQWMADGALVIGTGLLSYFLAALVASKIGKTIAGKEPGVFDRLLGAAFGVARGLIIAALFVMVTTADYRASLEASEFQDYIRDNPGAIDPEVLERMPESMRDQMTAEPEELPGMYQNSTFYPLLERIGDAIRALPFARMKSYAERIKDGDVDSIVSDIGNDIGNGGQNP